MKTNSYPTESEGPKLQESEILRFVIKRFNDELLAESEMVRKSFADDPEELVKRGRDILRNAMFRRRAKGRVRPLSS